MIIGICGFIGSGKDTAANYLVEEYGFHRESYAGILKDAICAVFGWDRDMLEGNTEQGRQWREQVDPWWAERLQMPELTPRWVMQYWGTDVLRKWFHDDIWIAALENRLRNCTKDIVISDCRFPNEIASIQNQGGRIVWVRKNELPEWYNYAVSANLGPEHIGWAIGKDYLARRGIHSSETSWVGTKFDTVINNDGTLDELYAQIRSLVQDPQVSKQVDS